MARLLSSQSLSHVVSAPVSKLDEAAHRHLADQLRRRARRARINLKVLAKNAGISEAGLHRILAGERSPRFQTLCDLARVLKCSPSKLVP